MIDQALPKEMQGRQWELDKKGLSALLEELARKHPEAYREVSHKLSKIGLRVAYTTGGNSFGLRHLLRPAVSQHHKKRLLARVNRILDSDKLDDDKRDQLILRALGEYEPKQQQLIFDTAKESGNPLANQVVSGSRGSPMNLASLLGSDLMYADHRGRPLPVPVLNNYSEGLSPVEYWAGAYGSRKGVIDVKFATQDAGFLSKQLNQLAHRLVVSGLDSDDGEPGPLRGLPVSVDDDESEGALLAAPVGGYKRNTILTPKILASLRRRNIKRMLVRSPAVGGPRDGGVYARDVGVREHGRLPWLGENPGMTAAQAMSEPLSQAQLSSKHTGGVVGASAEAAVSGFDWINQMIQVPKHFKGGAAHAEIDGLVQRVEDAPAGGKYVWIENKRHYVGKGFDPKVERGQHVEAGDVISDGSPNPSTIVKHKGIGEGRRYFVQAFKQAFRDAGIKGHRRNIELIARGLINHVRLTQEVGDYVPDDIVPYQTFEASYKPRPGYVTVSPKAAVGKYLERPYLHYSVGTKVRPSMMQDFVDFGVTELDVHDDDPPFEPEMVRGMSNLQHDPDWLSRMFGTGQKKSLLTATHRGGTSDTQGTSFVPGLAQGINFGRTGMVHAPKPHPELKAAQEQQTPRMTQEAMKQFLNNHYHAVRWAQALDAQRERERRLDAGYGSPTHQASDIHSNLVQMNPITAWYYTPAYLGDLALLPDKFMDNGLEQDEFGEVSGDTPGFSFLPEHWQWELMDWDRERKAKQRMTSPEGYGYQAVKGEQYHLPGQGKWIDEYNQSITEGEEPPTHVVLNAFNEMQKQTEKAGGGHWADPYLTPEVADLIHAQVMHNVEAGTRRRIGDKVFNRYLDVIEEQRPGSIDNLGIRDKGTATGLGNAGMLAYMHPGRAKLQKIKNAQEMYERGELTLQDFRAWADNFIAETGIDTTGLDWEEFDHTELPDIFKERELAEKMKKAKDKNEIIKFLKEHVNKKK
jgi:hypothetical protein